MPSRIFRENRNYKKIAANNQNETAEILGTHNKKKGWENLTLRRYIEDNRNRIKHLVTYLMSLSEKMSSTTKTKRDHKRRNN